jgi:hypothetical protein
MASLADLNLPNNIVYDERTKRYHDMLQNYRMVSGARVAAMGTPQRADRSQQYVTQQEFLNMRADLFRFVSHTTELTREALQALFEMQRAQLRDTERLRDYELNERENSTEGRESLLKRLLRGSGQLASGAMERVGNVVRARPTLSLSTILGASILGFAAIPNESVESFGATIDEAISVIGQTSDILEQIATAAGLLGAAEIARRFLQRRQNNRSQSRSSPSSLGTPRASGTSGGASIPGLGSSSSGSTGSFGRAANIIRAVPQSGRIAALGAGLQIAQANRDFAQGNITEEQRRQAMLSAGGGLLGGMIGSRFGYVGSMIGALAGERLGNYVGQILNRASSPPTTPEQRNQQAASEEQQLRERAANTPAGSLERRSLARVEAQNMIRTAQQENRLTPQQAQAISIEMNRGGRYQNRHEEVTRALREGGNLEISPDVARRLNLPQQVVNTPTGQTQLQPGAIQVLPPISIPNRNQSQPAPQSRQQAQTPVAGLQIRNPEQAMMEALMQHMLR